MMILGLLLASVLNIFVVESPSYTRQMVVAAHEMTAEHPELTFTLRTTEQVMEMDSSELKRHLEESQLIVLGRVYGDVAAKVRSAYPTSNPRQIVFAAHSDFSIYELNRYGAAQPFRGMTHERIRELTSRDAPPTDVSQLVRWSRTYEYLLAKGPGNLKNMLLDLLWELDPKYKPEPPRVPPPAFVYKAGAISATAAEAARYVQHGRPTVVIIDHDSYYHSGDVDLINRMAREIEDAGFNALPLIAAWGEPTHAALREFVTATREAWDIRAIVSLQSFVLGADQARDQVGLLLEELGLPVFRAMRLTKRDPDEWLLSGDGVPWGSVYYQVAMPELQGMIEPIVVAAEAERIIDSQTGAAISAFIPIEDRIQRSVSRVARWIRLQDKPNAGKRVALIYYNHPPGKQNIGADYLNVPETIMELVYALARDGYRVETVPPSADVLVDILMRSGINVANWALGQRRALAERAQRFELEEYRRWYDAIDPIARAEVERGPLAYTEAIVDRALLLEDRSAARTQVERVIQEVRGFAGNYPENRQQEARTLLDELQRKALDRIDGQTVAASELASLREQFNTFGFEGLAGWGPPPGDIMRSDDGAFIIPGIQLGNIFIGPQPQRGWQADQDSLHSSTVVPPHHQYLAFYAWLRNVFKADVIVHIGRHSSYEWLPRKQVGLTAFDFPDLIIDEIPAVYLYTVDGVGEGLQAKRRGLSVIIDHLIPPLKTTELYGSVLEFQQLIEQYESQDVPERRAVIARELRSRAGEYHFTSELGEDVLNTDDDQLVHTLGHYLEELKTTFLPYGLHTFGRRWTEPEIDVLAESMASMGGGDRDEFRRNIQASFTTEIEAFLGALRGRYVSPGKGNDPIRTPEVLPTGRNFYALDASVMPTKVAYALASQLVADALAKHETTPEKVAAVLWAVETVRDEGAMLSFILRLMGVEPVWDARGIVKEVRRLPIDEVGRPRIDVVVTSSGLFRDLFSPLVHFLDRAFRVALAGSFHTIAAEYPHLQAALDTVAGDVETSERGSEPLSLNWIARHWVESAARNLNKGMSAAEAGERALARIFGPAEGAYGSGISRVIEQAWTWETRDQVADVYIGNMAHVYSSGKWGTMDLDTYKESLTGVEQSFHSRATNLYGVVDNDDYFDYFGGLSMAIERLNGAPPENYVLFYADPTRSRVETLERFLTREMRSRYYNPEWIEGMMREGYSGARTISNKFLEFTWGWQVTNPEIVRDWMWNEVTDIYFRDKYKIGVSEWLQQERTAGAMINMASIMLTAANKGFWKAPPETLRQLADTLGRLTIRHGPSCSAHSCGDHQTIEFSREWMTPAISQAYARAMAAALSGQGYAGIRRSSAIGAARMPAAGPGNRTASGLVDFVTDRLPGDSRDSATMIDAVLRHLRRQNLLIAFGYMSVFLIAGGLGVFWVRDRYYKHHGPTFVALNVRTQL